MNLFTFAISSIIMHMNHKDIVLIKGIFLTE